MEDKELQELIAKSMRFNASVMLGDYDIINNDGPRDCPEEPPEKNQDAPPDQPEQEQPPKGIALSDLKVGMTVLLKTWDELAEEFFVDADGHIDAGSCFIADWMAPLLGKEQKIKGVSDTIYGARFYIERQSCVFPLRAIKSIIPEQRAAEISHADLKPGMTVLLKTWDELAENLGIDADGYICAGRCSVAPDMAPFLGKKQKITSLDEDRDFYVAETSNWVFPFCAIKSIIPDQKKQLKPGMRIVFSEGDSYAIRETVRDKLQKLGFDLCGVLTPHGIPAALRQLIYEGQNFTYCSANCETRKCGCKEMCEKQHFQPVTAAEFLREY